jgi:hypothetical protein
LNVAAVSIPVQNKTKITRKSVIPTPVSDSHKVSNDHLHHRNRQSKEKNKYKKWQWRMTKNKRSEIEDKIGRTEPQHHTPMFCDQWKIQKNKRNPLES